MGPMATKCFDSMPFSLLDAGAKSMDEGHLEQDWAVFLAYFAILIS